MEYTFIVKVNSSNEVTVDDLIVILGKGIEDRKTKNIYGITVRQGVTL